MEKNPTVRFSGSLVTFVTLSCAAFFFFLAGMGVGRISMETTDTTARATTKLEETVHQLGSAKLRYFHQEAASVETKVRILESDTYVSYRGEASSTETAALYRDLADLPGVDGVHLSTWSIHLEKTRAYSWAEIAPLLEKVLRKHGVA